MKKITDLAKRLREICTAEPTVLWLSGGKDSLLLLLTLRLEKLEFSVLRFDEGWTREQHRMFDNIIRRYRLRVYSYPPQRGVLLRHGRQVSSAMLYAVGKEGEQTVLIRDFVEGEPFRCALELNIEMAQNPAPAIHFPNHICGMKKGELGTLLGRDGVRGEITPIGDTILYAPLYDWTNVEVVEALDLLGEPWLDPPEDLDTGNIVACTECLKGSGRVWCPKKRDDIQSHEWDPTDNLNWLQEILR